MRRACASRGLVVRLAPLGVALGVAWVSACSWLPTRCSEPTAVATVHAVQGHVEHQHVQSPGWAPARAGASLHTGDALRTGQASSSTIAFRQGGHLNIDENSVVRFGADLGSTSEAGSMLSVEMGSVTLENTSKDTVVFETNIGRARLERNAKVTLRSSDNRVRIQALIGEAILETPSGKAQALGLGEGWMVSVGGAVVERVNATSPAKPKEPPTQPVDDSLQQTQPEPDATPATDTNAHSPADRDEVGDDARDEGGADTSPMPAMADLSLVAGESATVHDPRPPTVVGILVGDQCPDGHATLESPTRGREFKAPLHRVTGRGTLRMAFRAGVHMYRIRCFRSASVKATGSLHILKDDGRAQLPRIAPSNVLDANGKRYTVLYQNRLPEFVFRWPTAPPASQYVFRLVSRRGVVKEQRVTGQAKASFVSGQITEGTYDWWFETDPPTQSSPKTALRIGFDNAAASASIAAPQEPFVRGATVRVAGIALEDWVVRIGNTDVPLDDQNRFDVQVVAPTDYSAIAVRLSHPRRGTHYYLRRAMAQ
jgi:hypothetical protein